MKESISIKNFGPLKEVVIEDIRPLTVFIGESGSGKSTIMKVLVLFRWIYKMHCIRAYLKNANISASPFSFDFKSYLNNNGLSDYLKPDTEIIYNRNSTNISYKKQLSARVNIPTEEISLEKMSFISEKRNAIPDILSGGKTSMSFYLNETFNDFKQAEEYIKDLPIEYLHVKYHTEKTNSGTKYYIQGEQDDYQIKLEDASSGTQTLLPLALIVEYFSKFYDFNKRFNKMIFDYMARTDSLKDFRSTQNVGDIRNRNIHFHIEEPELSLFPDSQCSLINFLINRCLVQQHDGYNMSLMLTTHSPYIINHLNLLLRAYEKGKQIEGASVSFDDLAIYQVEDGTIENLKLLNKNLINTDPLSDTINDIYDEYNSL
jgi:AAA15 family ATPase/GTPase